MTMSIHNHGYNSKANTSTTTKKYYRWNVFLTNTHKNSYIDDHKIGVELTLTLKILKSIVERTLIQRKTLLTILLIITKQLQLRHSTTDQPRRDTIISQICTKKLVLAVIWCAETPRSETFGVIGGTVTVLWSEAFWEVTKNLNVSSFIWQRQSTAKKTL